MHVMLVELACECIVLYCVGVMGKANYQPANQRLVLLCIFPKPHDSSHRGSRTLAARLYTAIIKTCQLQPVCWHFVTDLFQQADVRMRLFGLWQLVDDKSVSSCQQTFCKLIDKTCYPQACCKLFQQVVTILQTTSCGLSCYDLMKLKRWLQTCQQVATSW